MYLRKWSQNTLKKKKIKNLIYEQFEFQFRLCMCLLQIPKLEKDINLLIFNLSL